MLLTYHILQQIYEINLYKHIFGTCYSNFDNLSGSSYITNSYQTLDNSSYLQIKELISSIPLAKRSSKVT